MSITAKQLYELLPAIYRIRDDEAGLPLKQLIEVLAEQAAVVEENIDQLYDDLFIETCADWVAPYIGGLIGYRPLHGVTAQVASPRAEVANTIGYRRRKGTAAVLEQLARDVTGWPARVVEYFQLVATAQRMNHIRPRHAFTPDLRDGLGLERLGSAFDPFTRTVDVRSIEKGLGLYNLPNIGIFLWRLQDFRRTASPAVSLDAQRFLFSPLAAPVQLVHSPQPERTITSLATPLNVPDPISRRTLLESLTELGASNPYYGRDSEGVLKSLLIEVDGTELGADQVEACNLSDEGASWANLPSNATDPVAIDPVLGRIALPPGLDGPVSVTYHYAFSAAMGGGEYDRVAAFAEPTAERPLLAVPTAHPTIQAALDALPPEGGIVEVVDNGRYEEAPAIAAGENASIELRAADGVNPLLLLTGDMQISGASGAHVTLDGLLVAGAGVVVPDDGDNALERLTMRHMTLVPGRQLTSQGDPDQPGAVSLTVDLPGVRLEIEKSILGPLRVVRNSEAKISDSILDAAAANPLDSAQGVAYAAPAAAEPAEDFGGALTLQACTVLGKIASERLELVSNSILLARLAQGDSWEAPVHAQRKQEGCLRFSFVPQGSIVPRRYRCQPQLAIDEEVAKYEQESGGPIPAALRASITARQTRRVVPGFSSRRYGQPAYGQLRRTTPKEIREGADDESEMGAFHGLYQPQRETNLRIRLDEYLRFGLEAGLFFET